MPSFPKSLQQLGRQFTVLIAIGLSHSVLFADDWPQWFGPNRDGIWRETGIIDRFPNSGPKVVWRTPIGAGYSGAAVAKGKVYITDRQPDSDRNREGQKASRNPGTDRVLCLDEKTGEIMWKHAYRSDYTVSYPSGPRATPAVDGNKVYSLGTEGNLLCLSTEEGDIVWKKSLKNDYNPKTQVWGHAASPLVDGDQVIVIPGGSNTTVVALDKKTGAERWRSLSTRDPGYCHPIIIESAGIRQLIIWHPESINSLNPETGEIYWTIPWSIRAGLTIATPRFQGNRLFLSSFYNGSTLLQLGDTKPTAEIIWQSKKASERDTTELHSIISTPVVAGPYVYGICSYGQLRCIKTDSGERVWETFAATTSGSPVRWATAFITPNQDRYFLFNESGDLIIADLTPKKYDELDRVNLLKPTNGDARGRLVVWSQPAYANKHIIVRNDEEIIRVSLEQ
ncbi:PQQ-like beta-propeller repeat protein [bacterium]|jgi:outer membrane protein assembly factor BamB|nr:PQQ-like beta-propeller repeat protein [Verrucomicrobiota bacterium]MDA7645163.1 PQQ-like beta-propeller repeat protein [bacterium]MDB4746036.1 PQQ-like beta-propeller repeat protein [Verrucomicrobiota bacterium]